MRPIGKYILVKNIDEEIKTESGLLLSANDASELRYKKAEIVVPGTDVSVVKSGDVVYYDKRAGYTMLLDGEHLSVVRESDLVLVL